MAVRAEFDAEMLLWMTVPLKKSVGFPDESESNSVIFGYADHHPTLGGQLWIVSTVIRELDEERGYAKTASGRRYMLRHRFEFDALAVHGREAKVAFALLLKGRTDLPMPIEIADCDYEKQWLTCGKIARNLGLMEPDYREREDVLEFVDEHVEEYQQRLRRTLGRE